MNKENYYTVLSNKAKIITQKIKKLKKELPELKYFTTFYIENYEKNNKFILYFNYRYPYSNNNIGYIEMLSNNKIKIYIYSNINSKIYNIIKEVILNKN
mgnify:CR=1 FL=1|tara:strand:- start:7321 stop:7617 length:297 start_codon:yes stop_codon:yes gene_type:complete